jgi:processive 1,2-diacylglycerol beta-glucosyltransferase
VKKIVIFHISEFGGHSKAAENLKEALVYKDPGIKILNLNGLRYFYPRGEKIVDFLYLNVIKYVPQLWGKAYDRKGIVKALSPYRKFINKIAFKKLNSLIKKIKPDCFVATQAFPSGVIADYKLHTDSNIPLVSVVTDYHPHRFWVHSCVDRYIVNCEEAKEVLVAEGIAKEKIKTLGIPISVKFLSSYPKEEISAEFGFSKDLNSVLIMGGGLGIGPMKLIAQELDSLDYNFQIIVVCGKNKALYEWFNQNKSKFKKPIFIFGYTEYIHKMMDFSDLIITKGGGITISEALAKGLCIIITNPIPGQEEKNVEYLLKNKAVLKIDDLSELKEVMLKLFQDKRTLYLLRERAKEISCIDSSLRIVDLIFELLY